MRGPGYGKNLKHKAEGVCSDAPGCGLKNTAKVKRPRGPKRGGLSPDGKVYLGVRVKMTVRDMLKNARLAQGWGPEQLQDAFKKKERVRTRSSLRATKKRCQPKSLEELAIIVEVLEEDLKTPLTKSSSHPSSNLFEHEHSPVLTGYNSDGSEDMVPSPQPHMSYSPWTDYYQALSPEYIAQSPDYQAPSQITLLHPQTTRSHLQITRPIPRLPDPDHMSCSSPFLEEQHFPQSWSSDSSTFFWTQLQKEEMMLNNVCDAELLATDEQGKNLLHNVVCVGKRALAYAIAKRMSAINSLDLKDSYGMTALHYAAKNNQHLMVSDLIQLGASINEKNNMGKTCLHLSAEKGYTQVLEVLKQMMMDGYFIDVEATDNSGMSVLQCAAVALKDTVCEVNSSSPLSTRLNSLRKEQMLETLEIVLQMASDLHSMGCRGFPHSS
ncbi:hypothetical protein WMY93_029343 [Mugilogobius chulae]|uniref:OCA domain-containing protein n=1 Tax=Mugilogobius chulae TaxID=88201 RepID=A0AAW0MV51_9GOBI